MIPISVKKIALFLLLAFSISTAFAQNISLSDGAKVSVITCGTGNESYSLFGHTALRIADNTAGIDVVYNYGAFDFNTPNFVMQFIKGDLKYFAAAHSYPDFIDQYEYEQRSVYEQELNMSTAIKQKIFDNLNTSLASGDSHYTYKFIDKNCTTMVVDIINKTLNKNAIVKISDSKTTYRTILFPYFDGHFYEKLGTSIIFGTKVDEMGTKIFLPFELMQSLQKVEFEDQLLAKQRTTLLEFKKETPASWWNNPYTYVLVLLGFVVINKKAVDLFYLSTMGVLGLFFAWIGAYSSHLELGYNYNIMLFNPLLLGLLYFYWTKNKKVIYNLALLNLIFLIAYIFILINKAHFAVVLPLVLCNGIIVTRIAMQNKKRIPIII